MRFMVIVKATKDSEAGVMPSERELTEMGRTTKSWQSRARYSPVKACTPP